MDDEPREPGTAERGESVTAGEQREKEGAGKETEKQPSESAPAPRGGRKETRPPEEVRRDRISLAVVLALILAYVAVFATLSVLRYSNFRAPGVDLGIFDQVIWLLSRGKGATSTIRGMNLFGDHMAPMLFLLVPLYWMGGGVKALLVMQTIALGMGALPIYLIARGRVENRWLAVAVSASYLLYPALQNFNMFDFHPEAFGLPLLLFAFLAVERRRFVWFYICCVGAAICKEDMALAVLVLGLIVHWKYDRRAGGIVATGSAAYFLAAVFLVIPRFGPEGFQYTGRLKQFGDSPLQAAWNMVRRPLHTLGVFATRQNLKYIFDLLMPAAFLSLLAPFYMLPALPAFLVNVFSDFQPQHTIDYHYTAAIIPFVFIAVVFGLARVGRRADGAARPGPVVGAFALVLIASALAGSFYLGPSPLSETWVTAAYRSDPHVRAMSEGVKKIPDGASVSAQTFLLPHLSSREKIYMFPQPFVDYVDRRYFDRLEPDERKFMWPGIYRRREKGADPADYPVPDVEYVALDRGTTPWPLSAEQYDRVIRRLVSRGGFEPVFDRDGVLILERRDVP